MNCKPGDLAVVVRSEAGNEGRIVRCLRIVPAGPREEWSCQLEAHYGPWWEVDQVLQGRHGTFAPYMADANLRAIRDPGEDARDQTLDWLPVPTKEIA